MKQVHQHHIWRYNSFDTNDMWKYTPWCFQEISKLNFCSGVNFKEIHIELYMDNTYVVAVCGYCLFVIYMTSYYDDLMT